MITEYETKLLASFTAMSMQQHEQAQQQENQARQLTALALSHIQTTQALMKISQQQAAILAELSKEPNGESLKDTMTELLNPLDANLKGLVESFNNLLTISATLSAQLPAPPTR